MHVLYFHQHFSTPEGASGIRSYEMAQQLIERGHEVTMVCGSYGLGRTGLTGAFHHGKRCGDVDGIHIVELFLPYSNHDNFLNRSWTFLRFAIKSIGIALLSRYDVLFATSTPLTTGVPGIFAHLLRRKPFVFEVRDLWPELPAKMGVIHNIFILKMLAGLEWLSYHAANKCIGLAPGIVEGIQRCGIQARQVTMIPNGCDLTIFANEAPLETLPEGIDPEKFLAIFTGAHGLANGLDAVLDAAGELLTRGRQDIQLILVGDGKLKPALQQRAKHEGLTNCVFLPPLPKKMLARLMKRMDVGLMILANVPAFYYGTSPNKFFDYIASGLPVINNYPGWLADMITAHHCGLVVSPDAPIAFATALEELADHRERLTTMGRNARKLAERDFTWEKLSRQFADWLEMV